MLKATLAIYAPLRVILAMGIAVEKTSLAP